MTTPPDPRSPTRGDDVKKPTPADIENYGCSIALLIVMLGAAVRMVWGMFNP